MGFTRLWRLVFAVLLVTALAACGDDDDGGTGDDGDETTTTTEAVDETTTTEASDDTTTTTEGDAGDGEGAQVTIGAVDYEYTDVPEVVEAGTELILDNQSEGEVHEILAFRLSDDETRSMDELVQLPEEELTAVLGGPPIAAVAPPGAQSSASPAPPAIVEDPGRYALVCFIPTGAPPDEVMAAVQEFVEGGAQGEPDYPETGPPHIVQGMYAELTVE